MAPATHQPGDRLLGGDPLEPIQLFPLRYPWAYAHAQQGKRNTWFPEEIPLADDVRDWELRLTTTSGGRSSCCSASSTRWSRWSPTTW